MAPSTPKRPNRPPAELSAAQRRKPAELPFDADEPSREIRSSRMQAARKRPAPPTEESGRSQDSDDRRATVPESPSPRGAEAFLYVERGPGAGEAVPVPQGLLFIGRASTSGLRIQHPSVSRRHAQITRNGERFYIRDLASQNGTYVNQIRIDKEVEIFPGDELVMGTAQLRLRGPGGSQASPRQRSTSATGARKRKGGGITGIAVAAGAVGFGLAALVMFAWFGMSRGPSYEELGDVGRTDKPAPRTARAEDARPAEPKPAEPKPAGEPKVAEATAKPAEPPVDTSPAPDDAQAEDTAPAKADRDETPSRPSRSSKGPALTPRIVVRKLVPSKSSPERLAEAPSTAPGDATILARFEAGNLDAAIELAKRKNAKEMLAKLTRFQGLYDSGQRALASRDEAGALKNLDGALKAAERLSGGWDKYSTDLRHQLSGLHLMAGSRLISRDPAGARKRLSIALQYDPENAKAREELAKLDPSAAPPPTSDKKDKKAIDEAFGN
jgi:pSer/pThr/pTyr-binding forkhead associated (FHA) protein